MPPPRCPLPPPLPAEILDEVTSPVPASLSPQGHMSTPLSALFPSLGPLSWGDAVTWVPTSPLDPDLDLISVRFASSGPSGPGRSGPRPSSRSPEAGGGQHGNEPEGTGKVGTDVPILCPPHPVTLQRPRDSRMGDALALSTQGVEDS